MALSIDKARSETRISAVASTVLLLIVIAVPSRGMAILISFPLIITVWLLLFHGTTWVSLRLQGSQRRAFQVAVALVVPVALSLYFISDTPELIPARMLEPMLSAWFLLPVAILGYISWSAADQLDPELPFRGFLIAAAVLFIICLKGYYGIHSEYDGESERSSQYIDKEAAALAVQSGRYFVQYLFYVAIVYGVMFVKLKKHHN